jgi:signal transduction histidine kinase
LKVLLSGATRLDDADAMRNVMRQGIEQLSRDIEALRGLIAELRPAALDHLGLGPALTSLVQRTSTTTGLEVHTEIDIPDGQRLTPELETTVYRIVQESLTNVAKHARAATVTLSVRCADDELRISIADDGTGFDPVEAHNGGFGLTGMRERVELAGGELTVRPGEPAGTIVSARLPVR